MLLQHVLGNERRLSRHILSPKLLQQHLPEHSSPSVGSLSRDDLVELIVSVEFFVVAHGQSAVHGCCDFL